MMMAAPSQVTASGSTPHRLMSSSTPQISAVYSSGAICDASPMRKASVMAYWPSAPAMPTPRITQASADLIGTQGKVSIVEYDGTTWGFGGGLGLSLAAKASVDMSYDDKEANAVKAAYLGAPDAAGSRSAYGLPECVG